MLKHKKGIQLSEAPMAVMTIALVAILVIVSMVIFSSLQSSMYTSNSAGTYVQNETVTTLNDTVGDYLTKYSLRDVVCSVERVKNATSLAVVTSDNYTVSNCLIKSVATGGYINQNVKVDYNYVWSADTAASNASRSMNESFIAYPALVGLVGTIIFLALVIGVLVASFAFGGKKGA